MAIDATGTPTPLGIPKYNPTADAPSGLGFNAAMDALDGIIGKAPLSNQIAGIAVGSVPVWDGSGWVKPSGTPDGTKFLRDDGTWAALPTSGTWQNYTPIWTTAGTAPSLGNGTLSGRYVQVGKLVVAQIEFVAGSTTTFGTSVYFFSLPVADVGANRSFAGAGQIEDASPSAQFQIITKVEQGQQKISMWDPRSSSVLISSTTPITFASGDKIHATITYEAA